MLKRLMASHEGAAGLSAVEAAELLHFCFLDALRHLDGRAQAPAPSEAPAQPPPPPAAQGVSGHTKTNPEPKKP